MTTTTSSDTVTKALHGLRALRELARYLTDLEVTHLQVRPYSFLLDAEIDVQVSSLLDAERLAERLREDDDPPAVFDRRVHDAHVQATTTHPWCGLVLRITGCEHITPDNDPTVTIPTQETKEHTS